MDVCLQGKNFCSFPLKNTTVSVITECSLLEINSRILLVKEGKSHLNKFENPKKYLTKRFSHYWDFLSDCQTLCHSNAFCFLNF